uniref:Uncharacterized protein n=1 Tax=Cucumis melo TaxID=3656 RepID=A0A9I9EEQ3_CUCME
MRVCTILMLRIVGSDTNLMKLYQCPISPKHTRHFVAGGGAMLPQPEEHKPLSCSNLVFCWSCTEQRTILPPHLLRSTTARTDPQSPSVRRSLLRLCDRRPYPLPTRTLVLQTPSTRPSPPRSSDTAAQPLLANRSCPLPNSIGSFFISICCLKGFQRTSRAGNVPVVRRVSVPREARARCGNGRSCLR